MVSDYIKAQPEAWLSWFRNNHDAIKTDSGWLTAGILLHAQELGRGMSPRDLKHLGLLYGCCIIRLCLLCALPVPVSNKDFVAALMQGYHKAENTKGETLCRN